MAFIMLAALIIPMVGMRMRLQPPARRRLVDLAAWKEPPYTIFGVAELFDYMGVYIPFFYIQLYAIEKASVNATFAVYMIVLLNTGSFFGRLVSTSPRNAALPHLLTNLQIPNYIADKIGPMNVLAACCLVIAFLGFVWIEIENEAGLVAFCLLYG